MQYSILPRGRIPVFPNDHACCIDALNIRMNHSDTGMRVQHCNFCRKIAGQHHVILVEDRYVLPGAKPRALREIARETEPCPVPYEMNSSIFHYELTEEVDTCVG